MPNFFRARIARWAANREADITYASRNFWRPSAPLTNWQRLRGAVRAFQEHQNTSSVSRASTPETNSDGDWLGFSSPFTSSTFSRIRLMPLPKPLGASRVLPEDPAQSIEAIDQKLVGAFNELTRALSLNNRAIAAKLDQHDREILRVHSELNTVQIAQRNIHHELNKLNFAAGKDSRQQQQMMSGQGVAPEDPNSSSQGFGLLGQIASGAATGIGTFFGLRALGGAISRIGPLASRISPFMRTPLTFGLGAAALGAYGAYQYFRNPEQPSTNNNSSSTPNTPSELKLDKFALESKTDLSFESRGTASIKAATKLKLDAENLELSFRTLTLSVNAQQELRTLVRRWTGTSLYSPPGGGEPTPVRPDAMEIPGFDPTLPSERGERGFQAPRLPRLMEPPAATPETPPEGQRPGRSRTGAPRAASPEPRVESATTPEGMREALTTDRARFRAELEADPALREQLLTLAEAENSGGTPGTQMILETMMNRASARGVTLRELIKRTSAGQSDHYYQPYSDGGFERAGNRIQRDPRLRQRLDSRLDDVLSGSNASNLATHNASGGVAANARRTQTVRASFAGEVYTNKTREGAEDIHGAGTQRRERAFLDRINKAAEEAQKKYLPASMSELMSDMPDITAEKEEPLQIERIQGGRIGGERGDTPVQGIVMHHTSGSSLEGAVATNRQRNTGYHYYVTADGKVHQLADDSQFMNHAGVARNQVAANLTNRNTIAISAVAANDRAITPIQRQTMERLARDLAKKHNIPLTNIYGHGEIVAPGHRESSEGSWVSRIREESRLAGLAPPAGNGNTPEEIFRRETGQSPHLQTLMGIRPTRAFQDWQRARQQAANPTLETQTTQALPEETRSSSEERAAAFSPSESFLLDRLNSRTRMRPELPQTPIPSEPPALAQTPIPSPTPSLSPISAVPPPSSEENERDKIISPTHNPESEKKQLGSGYGSESRSDIFSQE